MAGVTAMMMKNGSIMLLSNTDVSIPPMTCLGGVGGGQFVAKTDEEQGFIPYAFPHGVRTLISTQLRVSTQEKP